MRPLCVSEPENGKTTPAAESFKSLLARMPLILLDVYETLVSIIRIGLAASFRESKPPPYSSQISEASLQE